MGGNIKADFIERAQRAHHHAEVTGSTVNILDQVSLGEQPLCFVDQTNHAMRIGWYTDTYRRTEAGWRLATRKMTFLRKSGARDSGKPHDPTRPAPTGG